MARFMTERRRGPLYPFTFTAAVVAYRPVTVGAMVVIPQQDAEANVEVECEIPGVCGHYTGAAKAAGGAWTHGLLLYWDNANSRFTHDSTAAGAVVAAYAAVAAASADTTGEVYVRGAN